MANATGAESVDGSARRRWGYAGSRAGENKVDVILFRIEALRESLNDVLGAATAQVRNKQANPDTLR